MKVTIPHMGNVYIAAKILFDSLGIDYIIPPLNNKEALLLGSKHSPEEICLPFKLMIGNYIAGINEGADTVLLVGSCGPCRFGEYSELQIKILKQLGYNVEFIVIDPVKSTGLKEFLSRIRRVGAGSKKNGIAKINALFFAYKAINLLDNIEMKAHELAGLEKNNGECKRLLSSCKKEVYSCREPETALNILRSYQSK
ncbi:MAG: 2-hydroxyglutaryl-CoA dehydratase, partial [Ruminiclostridium sp.]|nr:2-hydroxyglutaryl-CoA dehydratase [Ruminiclostridium sp.]